MPWSWLFLVKKTFFLRTVEGARRSVFWCCFLTWKCGRLLEKWKILPQKSHFFLTMLGEFGLIFSKKLKSSFQVWILTFFHHHFKWVVWDFQRKFSSWYHMEIFIVVSLMWFWSELVVKNWFFLKQKFVKKSFQKKSKSDSYIGVLYEKKLECFHEKQWMLLSNSC